MCSPTLFSNVGILATGRQTMAQSKTYPKRGEALAGAVWRETIAFRRLVAAIVVLVSLRPNIATSHYTVMTSHC